MTRKELGSILCVDLSVGEHIGVYYVKSQYGMCAFLCVIFTFL